MKQNLSFCSIKNFYGTSLSSLKKCNEVVVKKYDGNLYRGFEKLKNEKFWLEKFPIN